MSLVNIFNLYQSRITFFNSLVVRANQIDQNGNFVLSLQERSFIVESAFLKMYVEWENFLESSFSEYLLGETSICGNLPVRYATPRDINHALNLIKGPLKYFDWSDPEKIILISEIYFLNGEPFKSTLNSIKSYLMDLRTIRNAAAHLSSTTSNQLNALSSRLLTNPRNNIGVGELLLSVIPSSNPPETILDSYSAQWRGAIQQISNF
jgi:hypothetical protein